MTIKILHLYSNCHGGTQRYVESIVNCLNLFDDVDNIVFKRDLQSLTSESALCIDEDTPGSFTLRNYNLKARDFGDPLSSLFDRELEIPFYDFLNRIKPDVVHFHHMYGLPLNLITLTKRLNIATALTLHDTSLLCANNAFVDIHGDICLHSYSGLKCQTCFENVNQNELLNRHNFIISTLNNYVDSITTVSKATANLFREYGITKNISVIYSGVDFSEQRGTTQQNEKIAFGYVGGAFYHKGIVTLLKAINTLTDVKAELKLFGAFPDEIKKNIQSYNVSSIEITFGGQYTYEETGQVFNQFDVLVFPSICFETAGLALLEARHFGVPSIFSGTGGLTEYVTNGIDGLAFKTGNYTDLAKKIEMFITNRELILQLKSKIVPPQKMLDTARRYHNMYSSLSTTKNENFSTTALYSIEEKQLLQYDRNASIARQLSNILKGCSTEKMIIFGTGDLGRSVYQKLRYKNVSCFFDNNESLYGTYIDQLEIRAPSFIDGVGQVIIASTWYKDINAQLLSIGYHQDQLVFVKP